MRKKKQLNILQIFKSISCKVLVFQLDTCDFYPPVKAWRPVSCSANFPSVLLTATEMECSEEPCKGRFFASEKALRRFRHVWRMHTAAKVHRHHHCQHVLVRHFGCEAGVQNEAGWSLRDLPRRLMSGHSRPVYTAKTVWPGPILLKVQTDQKISLV